MPNNRFKEHTRPIAQNLVASGLWELLRVGVPALVTWYAAHQTSRVPGWTTPWVILIGSVVFLSLTIAFRLVWRPYHNGALSERQQSIEDEKDETKIAQERILRQSALTDLQVKYDELNARFEGKAQQLREENRKYLDMADQKDAVHRALGEKESEVVRLKEEMKNWTWLRELAEKDRREINFMVRVTAIERGDLSYEPPRPYITFTLHLLNGSVFPVSIDPNVGGFISYASRRLGGELSLSAKWEVKNLKRGWTSRIEIHQWLDADDAEFIKSDANANNNFFNLEQVTLTITGGEPFYDSVTSRPLKITGGVDQSGRPRS